jgi:P-type Cu+ transporter
MESKTTVDRTGARTDLSVQGMNCSSCVQHVTEALQSVQGVASVNVSLQASRASVRWQPGAPADTAALAAAARQAGYPAHPLELSQQGDAAGHHAGRWRLEVLAAVIPTALLMIGEWLLPLAEAQWYPWAALILASIVQFGPGRQFYRGAWNQLKVGSSNMDTLVALGSTTAYGYSLWAMFSGLGGHLYFMESAAIITLISVGHWVEARVGEQASRSLRTLMNLAPPRAWLRDTDGSEKEVAVADLAPGHLVALKPGERVPTDGLVVEGQSAVDEAMLTGESVPVEKAPGAELFAGTINVNGRLAMRVTSVGEETALAQIISAVQRAQTSRANIQRLGDRVSSIFVPIVVLIALAAGLWWGLWPSQAHALTEHLGSYLWRPHVHSTPLATAVITAAAVLIIACPCAMGLATPAAIMAGANAAARRGILIRDGIALEKAGTISAVLLDKTGTLTAGRPAVDQIEAFNGASKAEVTRLAASLARHSNHPLSQAVAGISPATDDLTGISNWQELRGAGLQASESNGAKANAPGATVESSLLRLGSLSWLQESGVDLAAARPFAEKWTAQAGTVLGLARGKTLLGAMALRDPLKPGAPAVVARLRQHGMTPYLVTGDHRATAEAIARQAGIAPEFVFAGVRPEDKAALVRQLQGRGLKIAFVGDGINDAPALEQADLGVAVSRASDVAREAADIILLNSEIEAVPESLGLARATLRTIKQNLFWAFFYNALGIPLAALGFMSPILCAAAMGLSDLVVIGNALRLLRWKFSNK